MDDNVIRMKERKKTIENIKKSSGYENTERNIAKELYEYNYHDAPINRKLPSGGAGGYRSALKGTGIVGVAVIIVALLGIIAALYAMFNA